MISFQRTKNILIVSGFFLLLSIAGFILAIYYLNQVGSEIAILEGEVSSEKQLAEAANAMKRSLSENAGSIGTIDSFFVLPDEEADFIKMVEDLAKETKTELNISTFTHTPIENNQKFEYISMQATAKGSLQNIYQLFTILETLPKASKITQVNLSYIPGDPKKAREWRIAFSLRALKVK